MLAEDFNTLSRLCSERIAGTISPTDDLLLDEMIRDNAAARQVWENMHAALNTGQGKNFLALLNENEAWHKLAGRIANGNKQKRSKLSAWLLASAAMFFIVTSAAVYWNLSNRQTSPETKFARRSAAEVSLLADDGSKLAFADLGAGGKKIIKGAQLYYNNGVLHYSNDKDVPVQQHTIIVPPTRDFHLFLTDGTEVWLNASSSLKFPSRFNDSAREVFLEGEAYFKVSKQSHAPFTLHTENTAVRVLGTTFNVHAYSHERTEITLLNGAVITTGKTGGPVALKPGFMASYTDDTVRISSIDTTEITSWRNGIYYFDNKPLKEVLSVVERWYGTQAGFTDKSLLNHTISGAIDQKEPLDIFLGNLSVSLNRQFFLKDDRIVY